MGLTDLKSCCCGCSLQTGSLIIAWLGLVGGILGAISSVIGLVSNDPHQMQGVGKTGMGFLLVYCIICIMISVMLLLGVNRRIVKYVHAWVLINTISLVISTVYMLFNFVILLTKIGIAEGFIFLFTNLISYVIVVYLILVVHCYRKELAVDTQQA